MGSFFPSSGFYELFYNGKAFLVFRSAFTFAFGFLFLALRLFTYSVCTNNQITWRPKISNGRTVWCDYIHLSFESFKKRTNIQPKSRNACVMGNGIIMTLSLKRNTTNCVCVCVWKLAEADYFDSYLFANAFFGKNRI